MNGFLTRMLGRIRVDAPTPQLSSQQREILADVMAVLVFLRRAAHRGAVLAEDRAIITVAATACFAFEGFTVERLAIVAMIDAHFLELKF